MKIMWFYMVDEFMRFLTFRSYELNSKHWMCAEIITFTWKIIAEEASMWQIQETSHIFSIALVNAIAWEPYRLEWIFHPLAGICCEILWHIFGKLVFFVHFRNPFCVGSEPEEYARFTSRQAIVSAPSARTEVIEIHLTGLILRWWIILVTWKILWIAYVVGYRFRKFKHL